MPDVSYHAETHRPHSRGGSDPLPALGYYEIKVFADRNALDGNLPDEAIVVSTGDSKFVFAAPRDLDGCELHHAAAFVSVAGDVEVMVRNVTQAYDFLTAAITLSGDTYAALPATDIDTGNVVDEGDLIAVDVDSADGTAEGLGVILHFTAR